MNGEDEEVIGNSSETNFKCDQCDFESTRSDGLKIHTGKVHKNIIQVDGNSSMEVENYSCEKDSGVSVIKVVFVAEDEIAAEAELREYYIQTTLKTLKGNLVTFMMAMTIVIMAESIEITLLSSKLVTNIA